MQRIVIAAALFCSLCLSACAGNTRSVNMVPHVSASMAASKSSPLFRNIEVTTVAGGKETNPMWTSQVDSQSFQEALKQSLTENNYLAADKPGRYLLSANLVELKQPIFGLTLEVNSTVDYTLTDDSTKVEKFRKRITGFGTAGFSDSALAVERLRISNERSISNNLEKFLIELRQAN